MIVEWGLFHLRNGRIKNIRGGGNFITGNFTVLKLGRFRDLRYAAILLLFELRVISMSGGRFYVP